MIWINNRHSITKGKFAEKPSEIRIAVMSALSLIISPNNLVFHRRTENYNKLNYKSKMSRSVNIINQVEITTSKLLIKGVTVNKMTKINIC